MNSDNGYLAEPAMVAVDNASNIYVTDNLLDDVVKYGPCNNKPLLVWGSSGAASGEFNGPVGVAVDNLLNVYVGDSNNYRVQRFSVAGASSQA